MAKNDSTRQALEREYYCLLDKMCDCHANLTAIVKNASYEQSIKKVTDARVRDIRDLLEGLNRGLQEVISLQMKTAITIET